MAITNTERVGKAMDLLREGLQPFVERELKTEYGEQTWFEETKRTLTQQQLNFVKKKGAPEWDVAMLLGVLWNQWNEVFRKTLGHAERSLVSELRDVRNKWRISRPSVRTTRIAFSTASVDYLPLFQRRNRSIWKK